jgi:tetratricopeptide (TPR) repeat protein
MGTLLALAVTSAPAAAQEPAEWAGIEIGGGGVKVVLFQVGPGRTLTPVAAKTQTSNIAASVKPGEDDFDPEQVKGTVEAVRHLREEFANKVPDERVRIVASSGVARYKAGTKRLGEALAGALSKNIKPMEVIDTEKEVRWSFKGVFLKEEDRKDAIYVDIGGSNTKFGYVDGDKIPAVYGVIDMGSNSLPGRLGLDEKLSLDNLIEELNKEVKRNKIKEELKKQVDIVKRTGLPRKVYLGGGGAFGMAVIEGVWRGQPGTAYRPGTPIPLDPKKIAHFTQLMLIDKEGDPYGPSDKDPDGVFQKELKEAKKNYPRSKLVTAAALLQAVSAEFSLGDKKKDELYFVPNSHLAWLPGYMEGVVFPPSDNRTPTIPGEKPKTEPLSRDDLAKAVEDLKREIDLKKEIAAGNAQLKDISDKLKVISDQLGKLVDKTSSPAVQSKDLDQVLKALGEIKEAIKGGGLPPEPTKTDPSTAAWHFLRAREAYLDGRAQEALTHFDAATRADPGEPAYWYGMAIAQQRLGLQVFSRITARRVAAAFEQKASTYDAVCVAFERIQGAERTAVNGYIDAAAHGRTGVFKTLVVGSTAAK